MNLKGMVRNQRTPIDSQGCKKEGNLLGEAWREEGKKCSCSEEEIYTEVRASKLLAEIC